MTGLQGGSADCDIQQLRQRLEAEGVHTLIAQFTDLHGVAKGKLCHWRT